ESGGGESGGCGDEAEASQSLDPARSVALHGELLIVGGGVPVIVATLETAMTVRTMEDRT
ncbi:hypothetical protein, partial [Accumulibacter sp.]|uniref:hypothetical protein n=1 Tax=Accumulibacter sp. TaxID=2053492 RepID=UPI0035B2BE1A